MNRAWAFIVNPVAGRGLAGGFPPVIREKLHERGLSGEIALTKAPGHAAELARGLLARGFTHIVGVGGDGTLNEIAGALVGSPGPTLGAIPAGTGNDFVSILGFDGRMGEADWDVLFAADACPMDVGSCTYAGGPANGGAPAQRYFLNGMGLGFDAQVASEGYRIDGGAPVRKESYSPYFWHILKTILTYHERPMRVTVDGATERRQCFLNTIANGRRLAGGIHITPKAFADDGLLDVCMTDPLNLPMRFRELASFLRQTHLKDPVVHYRQTPEILFQFDDVVPAHLDGELVFASSFEIRIIPHALRAITKRGGKHFFAHA